jgi:hypothetical protein
MQEEWIALSWNLSGGAGLSFIADRDYVIRFIQGAGSAAFALANTGSVTPPVGLTIGQYIWDSNYASTAVAFCYPNFRINKGETVWATSGTGIFYMYLLPV